MSSPLKIPTARERFAQNLKGWRIKRGVSQDELADLTGLSRVYISRIENRKDTVSLDNIEKMASALSIDIVDLLLFSPSYGFPTESDVDTSG